MLSNLSRIRSRSAPALSGAPLEGHPRKLTLGAAIVLGTSLPLIAGVLVTLATDDYTPAMVAETQDYSRLEPGEDKPGGDATSRGSVTTANAFSFSSGNLDFKREFDFKIGNAIFRKNWVSAPASTDSSDGLGPLFNSRACQACHLKDGRGHPPLTPGIPDESHSMLMRLSVPPRTDEERAFLASGKVNALPEPTYGHQLQDLAIQGHKSEGRIAIQYEEKPVTLAGGETVSLRAPRYSIADLGYGPLSADVMMSPRVAPQMIGLGLLEAIPKGQIYANADPDDKDGDGISGRPNEVWSREQNRLMLGRFGWKAGVPSINQQTAEAASGDIGLSTTLLRTPSGDCTDAQKTCLSAPNGNSPKQQDAELGDELFKLITFYSHNLAVPARRGPATPEILKGKQIFHDIGCAGCHRPSFKTGDAPGQPHLANQLIWPYTDLLLHDIGEGLADDRPEGQASGSEWRTPPLWGIGLTKTVNGHTLFLHDGRARSVVEAILWHGGEAKTARDRFAALSKENRDRLLAFVNSL